MRDRVELMPHLVYSQTIAQPANHAQVMTPRGP